MTAPSDAAAVSCFSQTYAEARDKFLNAAAARGLTVQNHAHPMPGYDGEALALDVVRDGDIEAERLLIISSACHGVEGFAGSGAQVALLQDEALAAQAQAAGVAVLYFHALNPWGFSHWRRVTNEGVDLNRNFQDFTQPLPDNDGYDALAAALVPDTWPPTADNEQVLGTYAATNGFAALQEAISRGQYKHPGGLFYGGTVPTWSHQTLRRVLSQQGARCTDIGWIDLHTGLGPCGHGERIYAGPNDAATIARTKAWWGDQVTTLYDGTSTSAPLTGEMWVVSGQECPHATCTAMALEFGTVPILDVIGALRGDQWLAAHPGVDAALRKAIRQRVRDAFYVDRDDWKAAVVLQTREAVQQALSGLAAEP